MPRRSTFQREADLVEVAKWYCEGLTQAEIGQRLALSQQQISYDIRAIIARWQATTKGLLDELKAQELARINHLERVAWESFEASKEPGTVEIERVTRAAIQAKSGRGGRGQDSPIKLVPAFVETRTTPQGAGDPAWLRLVQWCISERAKILGLYAPTKVAPTMPDGDQPYEPVTDSARGAALMAAIEQISKDLTNCPEPAGD